MTRDQAAQIISQAIVANGSSYGEETLSQHIAAALDALGLLALATSNTSERNVTEEIAAAARIVSGDLLGQETADHAAITAAQDVPNGAPRNTDWAANRRR